MTLLTLPVGWKSGAGPTGIAYVGGKTFSFTTAGNVVVSLTDLTGGLASAPSVGDFILIGLSLGSNANVDLAVSGYTEVADINGSDAFVANLGVFHKFASGDTSVTIGNGTAGLGRAGAVKVFRGVDSTTPMDVTATTANGANTHLANPPSITPSTAGAVVVSVGAGALDVAANYTSSDLDDFLTTFAATSVDAVIGMGSIAGWVSGGVDPAVFGAGGTASINNSWAAVTVALRPAP